MTIINIKNKNLANKRLKIVAKAASTISVVDTTNPTVGFSFYNTLNMCLKAAGDVPVIVPSIVIDTVKGEADITQAPLDIVLLQDLSGSYDDDVSTVRTLVPNLVSSIKSLQPDVRFGVASFVDKPIDPFGDPGEGDYVYKTELPLTTNITGAGNALQNTINNLVVRSGNDGPEAQIEALMQLALRKDELGYRSSAIRVAILFTDAEYHVAGDGTQGGITTPNDGDAVTNGDGILEDYPSILQVKNALVANDVYPIFAITSDSISYYTTLVELLGRGVVVTLSSDSANIVSAVTTGLTNSVISMLKQPITGTTNNIPVGSTLTISLTDKNNYTVSTTATVKGDGTFEAEPINLVPLVAGMLVIIVSGIDILDNPVTNTFYLNFEH